MSQPKPHPIIWSISGSDCSGGAGIAADIKTGHTLGGEVCPLSTANTVQNSQQVLAVNPTDIKILQAQVEALLTDKPPCAIKIGLIVNTTQLNWLITVLKKLKEARPSLHIIYDPVAQASAGDMLSSLSVTELKTLWPYVDLITPNLNEAQCLSDSSSDNPAMLARKIMQQGIRNIIIKGGHSQQAWVSDYCQQIPKDGDTQSAVYQLSSPRIATSYSHGGGCSFASALAALLAQGHLLRDAFTLTKAFINQGLNQNQGKTDYYGAFAQPNLPLAADFFPVVSGEIKEKYKDLPPFKSVGFDRNSPEKLGLYPVVDSIEWLTLLLPLDLNIVQLRLKDKTREQCDAIIAQAVAICRARKIRLFINDFWQLAIKHGAYGVHLGQEDLQSTDLTQIQKAGLRLGLSTHGCYEFLLAQQLRPSYLAIGAIFPTTTKDMSTQIQGLDNLQQILTLAGDIPVVAIGGIDLTRAPQVWQTGVDAIAVVSAITQAEDPLSAVKKFQQILL